MLLKILLQFSPMHMTGVSTWPLKFISVSPILAYYSVMSSVLLYSRVILSSSAVRSFIYFVYVKFLSSSLFWDKSVSCTDCRSSVVGVSPYYLSFFSSSLSIRRSMPVLCSSSFSKCWIVVSITYFSTDSRFSSVLVLFWSPSFPYIF